MVLHEQEPIASLAKRRQHCTAKLKTFWELTPCDSGRHMCVNTIIWPIAPLRFLIIHLIMEFPFLIQV